MIPVLNNGWWMATDITIGPYSIVGNTLTTAQETNANIVRSFFLNEGWTIEAICGMLGNMMAESTINPAIIQATNRYRLPNSAANLSDVPNSIMQNFYMEYYQVTRKAFAIGLVQWDGYSTRNNQNRQKLVAYAMDNNIIWYDGWTQMYRLKGEQKYDVDNNKTSFFSPVRYGGITYTFANYPLSTASPDTLAAAWAAGYERNAGGVGFRADNARYFYNWFTDPILAPPIIPPADFLAPLPDDPYDPPFDPSNPDGPDEPGLDYIPGWLVAIFARKRKEMKRRWIKV